MKKLLLILSLFVVNIVGMAYELFWTKQKRWNNYDKTW